MGISGPQTVLDVGHLRTDVARGSVIQAFGADRMNPAGIIRRAFLLAVAVIAVFAADRSAAAWPSDRGRPVLVDTEPVPMPEPPSPKPTPRPPKPVPPVPPVPPEPVPPSPVPPVPGPQAPAPVP
jgi:hypothetical protein